MTTLTDDQKKNQRLMMENFDLMQVGDPLVWDVPNMASATRKLYAAARLNGWTISIRCTPALKAKYEAVPGQLRIRRL